MTSAVDIVKVGISDVKPLCSAETWESGGSGSEWGFVMNGKKVMVAWGKFNCLLIEISRLITIFSLNIYICIIWGQENNTLLGCWSNIYCYHHIPSSAAVWVPLWSAIWIIPQALMTLQTKQFVHLPMALFLSVLVKALSKFQNTFNISISHIDSECFDWLSNHKQDIVQVLKIFNSRWCKQAADGNEDDSDGWSTMFLLYSTLYNTSALWGAKVWLFLHVLGISGNLVAGSGKNLRSKTGSHSGKILGGWNIVLGYIRGPSWAIELQKESLPKI